METKHSIRKDKLLLRNQIPEKECVKKSRIIMQKLFTQQSVLHAEYLLCYAGYKSEVMTEELIQMLLQQDKKVYLPKVKGEEMDFYRIKCLDDLVKGYKDIPEPSEDCTDIFTKELWELNKDRTVMLLPGAAFSESGARIGYGKGYYDRYLNRIPCKERIGLCYELQMTETIPADDHDIPVTCIITEEKIRNIIASNNQKRYFI